MPANEMARWFGEGPPQPHGAINNRAVAKRHTLSSRCWRLASPFSVLARTPDQIPVAMEFLARPFDEALLFEIAWAYEAGTKHRRSSKEFGPRNWPDSSVTTIHRARQLSGDKLPLAATEHHGRI